MAPADPEQQNWKPSIERFLGFVIDRNCTHEIIEPGDSDDCPPKKTRPFMPLDQIQYYFGAHNYSELRGVLAALFSPDDLIPPRDIYPKYIAVFCTLLCIGKGSYIKHFKHHESLSDTSLPFDPASPPAHWPSSARDSSFLHEFCQAQWKFCARVWEDLSDKHYDSEQILPIVSKTRLSGGGSANIWRVKIHPFYNKLISEDDKLLLGDDANTFVLKEYSTVDARTYYENETAAFNKVGSGPSSDNNIIKHYGSFIRGDTFNLLLEYADKGTLRKVFAEEAPTSSENIIRFWEQIFKLMHSLDCIHKVKSFVPGGPQIFQGWHQDVKPENILVVSNGKQHPYEWQYKLADLGLSHFNNKISLREDSTASDTYGTRTYGAPECSRPDLITEKSKLRVKQNIDIWSLGCVYSEIIRWLAQGHPGVSEYQRERKAEIRELDQAVGATDCFHNGESVLDSVRKSHETSVEELRKTDFITDYVVDMVGDMLVDSDDRRSAQELWRKQVRILNNARKRLNEKRNSLSPGQTVNTNDKSGTPRSQTHPASSPSPILPPKLPPGFTRNGPSNSTFFPDDEIRLSLEPTTERSDENAPRQHLSPPNNSCLISPLTSPSAESPFFIPNNSQYPTQEAPGQPERGPWTEERNSPTPGSPQISELPSPGYNGYNLPNPRLISMTGSLGHNSPHPARSSILNGNLVYRRSAPAFDPQRNDFNAQQSTASINSHYRNDSYQSTSSKTPSTPPLIGVQYQYSPPPSSVPQPSRPEPKSRKSRSPHEISSSKEMSIEEALTWKLQCKTSKTEAIGINKNLRKELEGRDHIFLIDDSSSMAEYWDEVAKVFEALSYIVKSTDKDGLDLYFRNSENFAESTKKTSELIPLLKAQKKPTKDPGINFDLRLNQILEKRTDKLDRRGIFNRKPKPMSLYILTDGVWDFDGYAQEPIRNAVQKLYGVSKSRKQIGIQFIRFGDNPEALRRLEHLDNGLDVPSDIVDTEPADGNVWKMLLGPINPAFDGDQSPSPVVTPPADIAGPSSFNVSGYGR